LDEDKWNGNLFEEEIELVPYFNNCMKNHKIMQSKNNFIPKNWYHLRDCLRGMMFLLRLLLTQRDENVDHLNIGNDEEPKYIK
jgi:hypothetical protein